MSVSKPVTPALKPKAVATKPQPVKAAATGSPKLAPKPAAAPAPVAVAKASPPVARATAPVEAKPVALKAAVTPPAPKPAVTQPKIEPAAVKSAAPEKGIEAMTNQTDTIKNETAKTAETMKNETVKATEMMKKNATDGAKKAQAMFTEMGDRSKVAMEKSSKIVEEMADLTRGNVEALMTSSRVAAKGAEQLTREAAEFGRKRVESATATMKSFASAKSPTEVFQLQSDYAKSAFDAMVAEGSKLSEAWLKLAGDMFEPISSRYAVAADKIKQVAA